MALRDTQACNSNCYAGDHGVDCACPCKGCHTATKGRYQDARTKLQMIEQSLLHHRPLSLTQA
eukprot:12853771-Alexandrium_andersonii.AAC.1